MPNPVVHFEIAGKDGAGLQQFYRDAFGWAVDADNPMGYGMVDNSGEGIDGGITGGDAAGVKVFVAVSDLQGTLDRVASLGGRTVQEITSIPGMVTLATFADPEGNVIGIIDAGGPPAG